MQIRFLGPKDGVFYDLRLNICGSYCDCYFQSLAHYFNYPNVEHFAKCYAVTILMAMVSKTSYQKLSVL